MAHTPTATTRFRVPPHRKVAVVLGVGSALFAGVFGASHVPSILAGDGSRVGVSHAGAGQSGRIGPGVAPAVAADPVFPVAGDFDYGELDAKFGNSRGRPHEGQDVFAKGGTELVAVTTGVVVDEAAADSAYSGGRGNFIAIYDEIEDRTYVYFHMRDRSPLREGEQVTAGDPVGSVGCTGSCWGNHLHFEVRLGRGSEGMAVDPLPYLRRWESNAP